MSLQNSAGVKFSSPVVAVLDRWALWNILRDLGQMEAIEFRRRVKIIILRAIGQYVQQAYMHYSYEFWSSDSYGLWCDY